MGGLTREEVKAVRDKIPLIGDIPLLGKLFRSRRQSSQKRNLLIFVTARLSDSPNFDGLGGEIVRVPSAEVNRGISTDGQKNLINWSPSTKTALRPDYHRKIPRRGRF
jgi:hypothetical protein